MIKTEHLGKTYHSKVAVDDVSFTVATGKVTGFLGPNGAGKSTTMRLMVGLDIGAGTTMYDGKPLSAYAEPSRVVGILLEAKAFHPTRTAEQHLRILADAGGVPKSRVDEVLKVVGLSDVARKGPGKFSLGMAQRLGIAAAILGQPKYLILDEPANGLDPEGIAWLREFVTEYAKSHDGAVFISSHLLSEMSQMADNVVVIGKGKLIASGTIEDIISGSVQGSVFIRVSNTSKFAKALETSKWQFEKTDGGFRVTGTSTDQLGKLAAKADVTVLELSQHQATLEEAFLELTEGSEEFQTKGRAA